MKRLFISLCLVLLAAGAHAANEDFRSGPGRTSLIELYTSEGCSSCPGAERWLSNLKDDPELWKLYVPAAFHVDYWDNLGWPDGFAKPEFTERQKDYARGWKDGEVYTPAFVMNGQDWREWYTADAPPRASRLESPGELELRRKSGTEWRVAFRPQPKELLGPPYVAYVALLGFDATTDVRAGENEGKKLRHDFIALSLKKKTLISGGNELFAVFRVPAPDTWRVKRYGIACWVGRGGVLKPVQATGGYIEAPSYADGRRE